MTPFEFIELLSSSLGTLSVCIVADEKYSICFIVISDINILFITWQRILQTRLSMTYYGLSMTSYNLLDVTSFDITCVVS